MNNEGYKLQVSYKTPTGDMINVRADTSDELSVLLEGVGDYATQIASVQKLLVGAYNAAPLSVPVSTPPATAYSSPAPVIQPTGQPMTATPTCQHGQRIYKSGLSGPNSKQPGKPYSMWVCPMPQGPERCDVAN